MCQKFLISGRVQGVFYRASAQAEGERLGLSGWVRNLADGRVEAFACGDDQQVLQIFYQWLQSGPPMANVTDVDVAAAACESSGKFIVR